MHPTAALLALRGNRVYGFNGRYIPLSHSQDMSLRVVPDIEARGSACIAFDVHYAESSGALASGWYISRLADSDHYREIDWTEVPDSVWRMLTPGKINELITSLTD